MFESARTLTQAHAAHTHTTNLHATEQVRLEMRFQHHRRRRLDVPHDAPELPLPAALLLVHVADVRGAGDALAVVDLG